MLRPVFRHIVVALAALTVSTSAMAEDESAESSADSSSSGPDSARFRFGVSVGPSFFSVQDDFGNEVSLSYGGLDLRFGGQINHQVAVYVQPVLGIYSADTPGVIAAGGLLGATLAADVTFADRFFVGGGLGHHIYNSPSGPSLMLRAGGYPLMARSETHARRKGLMLSIDLRVTSLENFKAVVQPSFNVGYEAF